MTARVMRHGDGETFMRRARPWLISTEAENTLVLGIATQTDDVTEPAYFATIEQDDAVVGCAVRTPPRKLVVTRMPPSTAAPLAVDVGHCFDELPGVIGPPVAARELAQLWCERHGLQQRDAMQQRLYQLRHVVPPDRPPPGELRIAAPRDAALVVSWIDCFLREAGVQMRSVPARVARMIAAGDLVLWHDEIPRSLAGCSGRSPHGARIGYVYTPAEWRGRGYASACVAAYSQHLLYSGAQFCCLYTDLANPTSNAIYVRIGYEPVCDSVDIDFVRPEPAPAARG